MKRLLYGATIAAFALVPLTASATPSPSPSLDAVIAKPPAGFTELTTSSLHGEFTAHDWATSNTSSSGGVSAAETESTLKSDGFVDGYGDTWVQAAQSHALIEAVMAFTGGNGAKSALTSLEKSDKSDASYKHANTISGISTYYGAHLVDSSNTVVDVFGFVKGNDLFLIAAASTADDVLSLATTQAQTQYTSAPDSTIPSAQWPENATSPSTGGSAVLGFVILAIVALIIVGAVFLVLRTRQRVAPVTGYAPMAGYPMAVPPMSGGPAPMPMTAEPIAAQPMTAEPPAAAAPAAGEVQMSPDGYYWWDGQTWKDASLEAPPDAHRSADGTQWFDGKTWRPVPQAGGQSPS